MLDSGHALSTVNEYPATMNNITTGEPSPISRQSLYEALPDSQQSSLSVPYSAYAAPRLLPSSSDVSNVTAADTEFTSPISSNGHPRQSQEDATRRLPESPIQIPAPRVNTDMAMQTGNTAASPMSVDPPALTQGSKRTASGLVKNNGPMEEHPSKAGAASSHKRHISMDSATGSMHISQLSAQLRTRLSYAMIKVQNGWEKRSIEELEELPSQRGSPISAPEAYRNQLGSPADPTHQRRASGVSENSDRMPLSSRSSPSYQSRQLAATPSSNWSSTSRFGDSKSDNPSLLVDLEQMRANGPMLAPAAEIGSRRKRRSSASRAPPPLLSSSQRKHYSDLGASPRTPTTTPRAGILRMPSQQAEKDAVDTLLFMSSPKNSSRVAHTSLDSQPSPLKTEMSSVRRVVFESRATVQFDLVKPTTREAQARVDVEEMDVMESETRPPIEVGR